MSRPQSLTVQAIVRTLPVMPLARDLSDLPRARPEQPGEGWGPDPEPRFGRLLVERWYEEEQTERPPAVEGARFRHSMAGACSRAIAYAALNVDRSDPPDLPGAFILRQGKALHEAWQEALRVAHPDAEIELTVANGDRAGHVDAVVRIPESKGADAFDEGRPGFEPKVIAIEAKSVDGYSYKLAVGERGPAQGPKYQAVVQAALNAREVDADEAVVVYLARGAISVRAAAGKRHIDALRRVTAEWTLTREQYEPIADQEIERITGILGLLDEGYLPRRKIPDPDMHPAAVIVNPHKGVWETASGLVGSTWHCGYCRWQSLCVTTPADRVSIYEVELG